MFRTRVMAAEDLPIGTNTLWIYGTSNSGIHLDPGDRHGVSISCTHIAAAIPWTDLPTVRSVQTLYKGVV